MKFLKGLLIGSFAGFAFGTTLNDRQRKAITNTVRRQAAPVGNAIRGNVGQVADTIVDETTSKIDSAGDAVADTIAADSPAT